MRARALQLDITHVIVQCPESETRYGVSVHSRPDGVAEMVVTALRILFLAVAICAVAAVAFLLVTA